MHKPEEICAGGIGTMKGGGTNYVEKEYKDFVKKWEMILHELGKYGKLRPVIQIVKKSQMETEKSF